MLDKRVDGSKLMPQERNSRARSTPSIQPREVSSLMHRAVETQHRPKGHADRKHETWMAGNVGNVHTKTVTKKVLIPVEETVKVPVVRKEACRGVQQHVVKGKKLVPVTKYKEVEETTLQIQEELINGVREKRAVPITRMRKVPYREYEEKEVEIVVDVPMEQVKTRKGYRLDKHVVSKIVEVEEDHHYEMRPVYVGKGDVRMREGPEHHAFKQVHGKPVWEDQSEAGWGPRPLTPSYRADLPRPHSAGSIMSQPTREEIYGPGAPWHTRDCHVAGRVPRRPSSAARSTRSAGSLSRTRLPR